MACRETMRAGPQVHSPQSSIPQPTKSFENGISPCKFGAKTHVVVTPDLNLREEFSGNILCFLPEISDIPNPYWVFFKYNIWYRYHNTFKSERFELWRTPGPGMLDKTLWTCR